MEKKPKKTKFTEDISKLVEYLGGAENIASAMHCVSRVRMVVKDMKKVNENLKKIEELPSTKGTIKLPGNQFHVIIGTEVPEYFNEFADAASVKVATKEEVKNEAASRGNWLQKMMQHFSDIFIPIIPVIVAGGLILGFRNILEADFDGFKIVNESAFMNGVNDFLWIPAQASLWFLPVYICWSVFKKMGGSPIYGIIIGLTLLIPPLFNVYSVSGASKEIKWIWDYDLKVFGFDFGAFQYPFKIAYTAQVIPAIGVGFFGVYAERFATKYTTPVLRQIVVPLVVVLASYIVAMVAIGPVGWIIGNAISFAVSWALTNSIARYFFAPIFGLLYAPLVITGLHHMLNAVMIQEAANGGTIFFPILAISNICQGAAALTFTLINRTEKTKQIGFSATTSAWLGVTEPAMYGINLKYLYPFIASIVGTAVGSLLIVVSGVSAAGIGNGAWLGVLSIQVNSGIPGYNNFANQAGTGYTWFVLSALLATAITVVGTYFARLIPVVKRFETKIGIL